LFPAWGSAPGPAGDGSVPRPLSRKNWLDFSDDLVPFPLLGPTLIIHLQLESSSLLIFARQQHWSQRIIMRSAEYCLYIVAVRFCVVDYSVCVVPRQ